MDATKMELERDARRLLIVIGATVEQWILEHAKAKAAAKPDSGASTSLIGIDDIRESLGAFVSHGVRRLELDVISSETPLEQYARRAG